jgi:hypothetical protein
MAFYISSSGSRVCLMAARMEATAMPLNILPLLVFGEIVVFDLALVFFSPTKASLFSVL